MLVVCIVLSVDVVSELEYIKTDSFLLLILLLLVFKVLIFLCSKYIACNKIKSKNNKKSFYGMHLVMVSYVVL